METIDSLAAGLARKEGYACLKRLLEISTACEEVYPYFDTFVPMLDDKSSFVRTRGLLLIAANARWDTQNKVDAVLDKCLAHILDAKPSVSRQFIQALPGVAKEKPALAPRIRAALLAADTSINNDSMQPLVQKDIAAALAQIAK